MRITGVIVAVDEFPTRRIYTIDDSSGACIECTCPAPAPAPVAASLSLPTSSTLPGHLPILTSTVAAVPAQNKGPRADTLQQQPKQRQQATPAPATPSTADPLVPWDELDVGVVVKIKGKPGQFRETKQIEIVKAEVMRATQQEVRCWDEVRAFRRDVLSVPWVVEPAEEERLKRKALRGRQFSDRGKGRGKEESEESRKRRKEAERRERKREESKKRRKGEGQGQGQGLSPGNKVNYPSLAVRRRVAEKVKGKLDALGI